MRLVSTLVSAMMKRWRFLGLFLSFLCLDPASADAGKRVALVIGNSNYARVAALPNPGRDAGAMGELFRRMGFERVEVRTDLGQADLRKALREFSQSVRDADIAVVFYAGHGIEVAGTNYLIPVDAVLERDTDVEDEAVSLERVSQLIEPARRLRLIILDACRDNPFAPGMRRSATRSIGRGFARVEVQTQDSMIAFAARPGATARDGDGANSPYTTALLRNLATPGLDIRLAMGRVRDEVLAATAQAQEPTLFTSLGGAEIALVPGSAAPLPPSSPVDPAALAWMAVRDTTSIAMLEEFLRKFGNSLYASFAQARIEELRKTGIAASVSAPHAPSQTLPAAPPLAPPPIPALALPANLPIALAEKDLARLRGFEENRATAIKEAMDSAASPTERNTLKAALAGRPLPVTPKQLVREWRCRTIKMGGAYLQLVIYESFRCRIAIDASGLTFRKTTGSQRTQGRLYPVSDTRYLYVGASTVNDDPPITYGTTESEDQVAWLVRVDTNRLRLEFPKPHYESHFDIIELFP